MNGCVKSILQIILAFNFTLISDPDQNFSVWCASKYYFNNCDTTILQYTDLFYGGIVLRQSTIIHIQVPFRFFILVCLERRRENYES